MDAGIWVGEALHVVTKEIAALGFRQVPGKGGVKATNATGVWAMDFTHDMRLLFRTGDTIGGKTVKSFALLKATVGNMGVTRSFNNSQVVWLATFTDKSTAIITTEVP